MFYQCIVPFSSLLQVSALPVADTVGYVKQATLLMIQHLNKFSIAADERLRLMSASISRLETELTILESKVSSLYQRGLIAGFDRMA